MKARKQRDCGAEEFQMTQFAEIVCMVEMEMDLGSICIAGNGKIMLVFFLLARVCWSVKVTITLKLFYNFEEYHTVMPSLGVWVFNTDPGRGVTAKNCQNM